MKSAWLKCARPSQQACAPSRKVMLQFMRLGEGEGVVVVGVSVTVSTFQSFSQLPHLFHYAGDGLR